MISFTDAKIDTKIKEVGEKDWSVDQVFEMLSSVVVVVRHVVIKWRSWMESEYWFGKVLFWYSLEEAG
jgi:hypothetical protein